MNREILSILVDPDVFEGKPYIEGRRITVQHVVEYYTHFGWPIDKIAAEFELSLSQIHSALAYYYAHQSEIDEAIARYGENTSHLPHVDSLQLIMTPQEIADTFGITSDAVYQAVRRGRLAARKSGKTLLILRRDAQALWG